MTPRDDLYKSQLFGNSFCPVLCPTELLKLSDIFDLLSAGGLSSDMFRDRFMISWSDLWHETSFNFPVFSPVYLNPHTELYRSRLWTWQTKTPRIELFGVDNVFIQVENFNSSLEKNNRKTLAETIMLVSLFHFIRAFCIAKLALEIFKPSMGVHFKLIYRSFWLRWKPYSILASTLMIRPSNFA